MKKFANGKYELLLIFSDCIASYSHTHFGMSIWMMPALNPLHLHLNLHYAWCERKRSRGPIAKWFMNFWWDRRFDFRTHYIFFFFGQCFFVQYMQYCIRLCLTAFFWTQHVRSISTKTVLQFTHFNTRYICSSFWCSTIWDILCFCGACAYHRSDIALFLHPFH